MFSTQECYKLNVRAYRRGNQKWTIQRNWQHSVHKTKKKQNKNIPKKLAT